MNTYKFRAECIYDVNRLTNLLVIKNIKSEMKIVRCNEDFPDCEVTMTTSSTLNEIKSVIEKVPDGHVILETIQPVDYYNGKRDHALQNVTRLKGVTVLNEKDIPIIGVKGDTEIIVQFSNRRFQAVSLRPLDTPEDIGKAFIRLGKNILRDQNLK